MTTQRPAASAGTDHLVDVLGPVGRHQQGLGPGHRAGAVRGRAAARAGPARAAVAPGSKVRTRAQWRRPGSRAWVDLPAAVDALEGDQPAGPVTGGHRDRLRWRRWRRAGLVGAAGPSPPSWPPPSWSSRPSWPPPRAPSWPPSSWPRPSSRAFGPPSWRPGPRGGPTGRRPGARPAARRPARWSIVSTSSPWRSEALVVPSVT